ncbi:hypothetical protein AYI70_g8627 [Smittium culicis]|uniref:Uncharacterized protein n=1 Tax=Smittium culicis TaxID=133412 RepID=A0A1R1XF86_9FUNG|nr:hypothetical protein AYI70_g8627 [Smittium culicis]
MAKRSQKQSWSDRLYNFTKKNNPSSPSNNILTESNTSNSRSIPTPNQNEPDNNQNSKNKSKLKSLAIAQVMKAKNFITRPKVPTSYIPPSTNYASHIDSLSTSFRRTNSNNPELENLLSNSSQTIHDPISSRQNYHPASRNYNNNNNTTTTVNTLNHISGNKKKKKKLKRRTDFSQTQLQRLEKQKWYNFVILSCFLLGIIASIILVITNIIVPKLIISSLEGIEMSIYSYKIVSPKLFDYGLNSSKDVILMKRLAPSATINSKLNLPRFQTNPTNNKFYVNSYQIPQYAEKKSYFKRFIDKINYLLNPKYQIKELSRFHSSYVPYRKSTNHHFQVARTKRSSLAHAQQHDTISNANTINHISDNSKNITLASFYGSFWGIVYSKSPFFIKLEFTNPITIYWKDLLIGKLQNAQNIYIQPGKVEFSFLNVNVTVIPDDVSLKIRNNVVIDNRVYQQYASPPASSSLSKEIVETDASNNPKDEQAQPLPTSTAESNTKNDENDNSDDEDDGEMKFSKRNEHQQIKTYFIKRDDSHAQSSSDPINNSTLSTENSKKRKSYNRFGDDDDDDSSNTNSEPKFCNPMLNMVLNSNYSEITQYNQNSAGCILNDTTRVLDLNKFANFANNGSLTNLFFNSSIKVSVFGLSFSFYFKKMVNVDCKKISDCKFIKNYS